MTLQAKYVPNGYVKLGYEYDDGGFSESDVPGDPNCAVRALSILLGEEYSDVHDLLIANTNCLNGTERTYFQQNVPWWKWLWYAWSQVALFKPMLPASPSLASCELTCMLLGMRMVYRGVRYGKHRPQIDLLPLSELHEMAGGDCLVFTLNHAVAIVDGKIRDMMDSRWESVHAEYVSKDYVEMTFKESEGVSCWIGPAARVETVERVSSAFAMALLQSLYDRSERPT